MIITTRRTSLALSVGLAALALALSPVAAHAHPGTRGAADHLTLDPTARATADGVVTVGGTYTCSPEHTASVLLGANLRQGPWHASVGGDFAECDGHEHTWHSSARVGPEVVPAIVQADATMLELDFSGGLIPRATILATDAHDVVVERV
ncbi:DUF6299 family protein [Streptomyces sp. SID3343]|uniref:DUF6299 family protein n=1 Tax=Streptomyces sp. SID3343 TaxID=2690260 RepID=UPI0013697B35|nr:DUF6299 family protein [Streptomyces sp. SID3343]MYV98325.1 hypothetical protein [Streptomyces sp. SID3343]